MGLQYFHNRKLILDEKTIHVLQEDIKKTVDYGRIENLENLSLEEVVEENYNTSLFFSLGFKSKIINFLTSPIRLILTLFSIVFISRMKIIYLSFIFYFLYEMANILEISQTKTLDLYDVKNICCLIVLYIVFSVSKSTIPFFQEVQYMKVYKIFLDTKEYGRLTLYESAETETLEDVKIIFKNMIENINFYKENEEEILNGELKFDEEYKKSVISSFQNQNKQSKSNSINDEEQKLIERLRKML